MKRARGLEFAVLIDISLKERPGWNSRVAPERIAAAIERCREKGWLAKNRLALTKVGKEAAGLVLREVPLPAHLADLLPSHLKQGKKHG